MKKTKYESMLTKVHNTFAHFGKNKNQEDALHFQFIASLLQQAEVAHKQYKLKKLSAKRPANLTLDYVLANGIWPKNETRLTDEG